MTTLSDLIQLANDTPTKIKLRLMFSTSPEDLLECVDRAIDWISLELSRSPKHKKDATEDSLNNYIVSLLRAIGFQAYHDAEIGGHCDVVIEGRDDFLWLGEAKIYKGDYAWLLKGFQQLNTRYSTANPRQNAGGLIIYSFRDRIDITMDKWRDRIRKEMPEIEIDQCPINLLAFISSHKHRRTGIMYQIRHVPISLYFNPRE